MSALPKGGSVSGGAGSLDARLDDITSEAGLLTTMSLTLLDESARVKNVVFDGRVLESAPLAPRTFAIAEAEVTLAAGDLLLRSGELGALAVLLHGVVTTYTVTDAALASAAQGVQYAVGFEIGLIAPQLLLGTVLVGAFGALAYSGSTFMSNVGAALGDSTAVAWNTLMQQDPWSILRDPATAIATATVSGAGAFSMDDVLASTAEQLSRSLAWLMNDTGFAPALAGALVGIMPGLLAGMTASTGPLAPAISAALTLLSGGPWPPRTYEQVIDRLLKLSNNVDLLYPTEIIVKERDWLDPSGVKLPSDIAILADDLRLIDLASVKQGADAQANIAITQHNGNYIIMIPSTLNWDWRDTGIPADLTSNMEALSSQHQSELSSSVLRAMKLAGIPRGANVMLSGFSQGGITAAALTEQIARQSDPVYNVTNVVTFGSPIATFDIPDAVNVLSFQHAGDFIPSLNGSSNPVRSNWTTITSNVQASSEFDAGDLLPSHSAAAYTAMANAWQKYATSCEANTPGQRAIADFQKSAEQYFGGPGVSNSNDTVWNFAASRISK